MNNNCNNCNKEKNTISNSCNTNCVIQQCGKLYLFISHNHKECDFVEIKIKNNRKAFYKKNHLNYNLKLCELHIFNIL